MYIMYNIVCMHIIWYCVVYVGINIFTHQDKFIFYPNILRAQITYKSVFSPNQINLNAGPYPPTPQKKGQNSLANIKGLHLRIFGAISGGKVV